MVFDSMKASIALWLSYFPMPGSIKCEKSVRIPSISIVRSSGHSVPPILLQLLNRFKSILKSYITPDDTIALYISDLYFSSGIYSSIFANTFANCKFVIPLFTPALKGSKIFNIPKLVNDIFFPLTILSLL